MNIDIKFYHVNTTTVLKSKVRIEKYVKIFGAKGSKLHTIKVRNITVIVGVDFCDYLVTTPNSNLPASRCVASVWV